MKSQDTMGITATFQNTQMALRVLITMLILSLLFLVAPIFRSDDAVQAQPGVSISSRAPSFGSFLQDNLNTITQTQVR